MTPDPPCQCDCQHNHPDQPDICTDIATVVLFDGDDDLSLCDPCDNAEVADSEGWRALIVVIPDR